MNRIGKKMVAGAVNMLNQSLPSNVAQPIVSSMNAVPEKTPIYLTLPIILSIGSLIIIFVLVVIFKSEINTMFITLFEYLKTGINYLTPPPTPTIPDPQPQPLPIPQPSKEVFNVSENKYIYSDAEPLCKSLGAELATYDEVLNAWKNGADWCNYGWSKGQTALYPTQSYTYDQLQKSPTDDQRRACGKVGINGGYFENDHMKFGVNCFGDKPVQTLRNTPINLTDTPPKFPPTPAQQKFDEKVSKYKAESKNIKLNPFNTNSWNSAF